MEDLAALAKNIPSEVLDYIEELEDTSEMAVARIAELEKALDSVDPTVGILADDEIDPIAKALTSADPELVQLFKSQSERLVVAEAALTEVQEREQNAQWIAKTRSIDGLVDPEVFGPKLRALAEHDAELADEVNKILAGASEKLAKSKMFDEVGYVARFEGEVADKVIALAKSIQESNPAMSDEEARTAVWETNPELYDEYVTERREAAPGR
jgi:hypothetical protein